jgi:succinate dehydrogenase flavin-adding protein (antitoxin of CptAB toxin-antitoxin module)
MTDSEDLLAPFDDDIVELVARRHDCGEDEIRELLRRHQRQVREMPGVEDIVYEWRSQFHEQPVLQRTAEAYYLRLREHVWEEFADALDLAEVDFYAVLDAHEEQTRRKTGAGVDDRERMMVLTRVS